MRCFLELRTRCSPQVAYSHGTRCPVLTKQRVMLPEHELQPELHVEPADEGSAGDGSGAASSGHECGQENRALVGRPCHGEIQEALPAQEMKLGTRRSCRYRKRSMNRSHSTTQISRAMHKSDRIKLRCSMRSHAGLHRPQHTLLACRGGATGVRDVRGKRSRTLSDVSWLKNKLRTCFRLPARRAFLFACSCCAVIRAARLPVFT